LGADIYIKAKLKKHEIWASYTISSLTENFDYFDSKEYELAPHNQTHEIKSAGLLNFSPFFISTTYVYGSGLEFTKSLSKTGKIIPYSRLDFAVLYKIPTKKIKLDVSFSILNVLNTRNIRYTDYLVISNRNTIFSRATSFTPLLNLHFAF